MTTGEAVKMEIETGNFPVNLKEENRAGESVAGEIAEIKFAAATNRNVFQERFAKLKKSLRRRSVSIF